MTAPTGDTVTLSIEDVEELTYRALTASGTTDTNARSVTRSVVASELDGIHSHGLARLPCVRRNTVAGRPALLRTHAGTPVARADHCPHNLACEPRRALCTVACNSQRQQKAAPLWLGANTRRMPCTCHGPASTLSA